MNNFNNDDFIGFTVSSSKEEYDKYVDISFNNLGIEHSYVDGILSTNIATEYNKFIRRTKQRFIIFAHQDVEFSSDIISIFNNVYDDKTIGIVGIFGRGFNNVTYFGGVRYGDPKIKNVQTIQEVSTLDSSFSIIDRQHNMLFDDQTFNGLHCYVEDYCCSQRLLGRKAIVIGITKGEHWGTTTAKLGSSWGNYMTYYKLLHNKWDRKLRVHTC